KTRYFLLQPSWRRKHARSPAPQDLRVGVGTPLHVTLDEECPRAVDAFDHHASRLLHTMELLGRHRNHLPLMVGFKLYFAS
ncbi:Os04g0231200, partial [Oryza sativa Japonica Group]